jgi:hypothetical protein
MTVYRSKIGLEFVIPLALLLGTEAFIMIYKQLWGGLFIVLLVAAFISYVFRSIYYVINNGSLEIHGSSLFYAAIDIASIKSVAETNNILGSPAASIDRLKIEYNKYDSVMISPKDKYGFVNELIGLNPNISPLIKE